MKYYCENCGSEFIPGEEVHTIFLDGEKETYICQVCTDLDDNEREDNVYMKPLPVRETVAQWEKRKGRKYPNTAPVYRRLTFANGQSGWSCKKYNDAIINQSTIIYCHGPIIECSIVVATEAGAPPKGWRPE